MGTTEESRMKELIEDLQKQVTALKVVLEVERGFRKQQWIGLTDEETKYLWEAWRASIPRWSGFARGVEIKLREKNGYGS